MPWPQTGATQYHAQLGLPDKGRAIKGLIVCCMAMIYDLLDWSLDQRKVDGPGRLLRSGWLSSSSTETPL